MQGASKDGYANSQGLIEAGEHYRDVYLLREQFMAFKDKEVKRIDTLQSDVNLLMNKMREQEGEKDPTHIPIISSNFFSQTDII